jgi:hypothetical protein
MSRRKTDGLYVGKWGGRHVRRRELVPALFFGSEVLFPPSSPYVDSSLAWMTMKDRNPSANLLPLPARRYYASKIKKTR